MIRLLVILGVLAVVLFLLTYPWSVSGGVN